MIGKQSIQLKAFPKPAKYLTLNEYLWLSVLGLKYNCGQTKMIIG